jgi:hypothetical protein
MFIDTCWISDSAHRPGFPEILATEKWRERRDSNPQPPARQAGVPTELRPGEVGFSPAIGRSLLERLPLPIDG